MRESTVFYRSFYEAIKELDAELQSEVYSAIFEYALNFNEVELIWRESRFNPLAVNGSHYGLAQMRNVKVKDLTPRAQVRWHMRYLDHRYDGSPCKALNHLKNKGWH